MAEIPSNVVLIDEFLKIFDGVSIGSNDLTQLALGIDRDNANLQNIADERNETVKIMIKQIYKAVKLKRSIVVIVTSSFSTFLYFAKFLIKEGIESIFFES